MYKDIFLLPMRSVYELYCSVEQTLNILKLRILEEESQIIVTFVLMPVFTVIPCTINDFCDVVLF